MGARLCQAVYPFVLARKSLDFFQMKTQLSHLLAHCSGAPVACLRSHVQDHLLQIVAQDYAARTLHVSQNNYYCYLQVHLN